VQLGEVVPTDLNALLRETLPLLEPLSRQHGVSLRLDPDLRLPVVQVDPVAMQLAVINLACNAIEASAATKVPRLAVDLATRVTADGVEIVIRDRGVGLPEAAADQCFIPLYSSKPSAPGLGLSISEAIARQHAGRVTLEPNPDGGVTARLSVPCADPARGDVAGEP
jgi:signal transduction histidine kinase